jgi:hypothetical protein
MDVMDGEQLSEALAEHHYVEEVGSYLVFFDVGMASQR